MRSCLQNLWTRYLIVVSLLALVLLHQAFNSYLTAQRSARSSMADAPLFTFALMTDLQYADKDNGNFDGRVQRHREVPGKLRAAVDDIIRVHKEASNPGGLAAALHLGDIIDGYANDPDEEARSAHDLDAVLAELQRLEAAGVPMRHVFGNHCFALPRAVLLQRLGFPEGSSGYYSVELGPGWRLVVLDTTDLSLYGHQQGAPQAAAAAAWLKSHPLSSTPNAQAWNGGLGADQIAWLRKQLADAAAAGERVIVACHHPLAPGSAPEMYLAWDHDKIRAILEEKPGVVALALTGHYHPGGAAAVNGIHYVTCEGMLEAPTGSNAFAYFHVHSDKIVIEGQGCSASRELPLSH